MKWVTQEGWSGLWNGLGATGDGAPVFARLMDLYGEPQRSYHDLRHLEDCLAELDSARALAREPLSVEAALWFHDAVYNPRATTNEEQSAHLAEEVLGTAGVSSRLVTSIRDLVLVTKTHDPGTNPDARLLTDIDLAIFGQPPARFHEYEQAIRREYAWVEAAAYRSARVQILHRFQARPFIYSTDYFRGRYEPAARGNLTRSLQFLEGAVP